MKSNKSVLLLFFSLLMVALFSAPLVAAEGDEGEDERRWDDMTHMSLRGQ